MKLLKYVEVFGDSILKGVQLDENKKYRVNNNIDIAGLESKFQLSIKNFSNFGATITKGLSRLEKHLVKDSKKCDAIVMDFGGNDCNFKWNEVAESPSKEHLPNTTLSVFVEKYKKTIALIEKMAIKPIVTTLPPLDAQRFFDWVSAGISKDNILKWLGSVEAIYRWQENYSRTIERIAEETGALLVDLRGAFLRHRKIEHLLCADGMHPNTEGQRIISQEFFTFVDNAKRNGKIEIFA